MEVSRSVTTAVSATADVGRMAQPAISLEATVLERGEARAEVNKLTTTHLGILSGARDERQKNRRRNCTSSGRR
eukprot:14271023-Alexandrium_andersonii.AAC.1